MIERGRTPSTTRDDGQKPEDGQGEDSETQPPGDDLNPDELEDDDYVYVGDDWNDVGPSLAPSIVTACLGAFLFGYHSAVINAPLADIAEDLGFAGDNVAKGAIVSIMVVGGFAGGEKRLQQYRQELNEADAQEKVKKGKKPRKETQDVVLAKDFNSAAGGIFFGEVGLQSWKETGRIPTRSKEATLGWGPPVLLAVAALAGVTYKTTGALSVDAVTKTVESVGSGVTSIDVSDVVGKVGGAVGALDEGASVLPPEVRSVATQAALVGFGVLALYALVGKVVDTAK